MSDLYLDKNSPLGLYLMNESNNVDLESVDALMRPIVELLTTKTKVISRYSCEGHLKEVGEDAESYESSYLMMAGDANDHEFVQHWLLRIQSKLQDETVIRCKLEYHKSMVFDEDQKVWWYPSLTIRSREHSSAWEVEEYHKAMLESLKELINEPEIYKLVRKYPTFRQPFSFNEPIDDAWLREKLEALNETPVDKRDFLNVWIADKPTEDKRVLSNIRITDKPTEDKMQVTVGKYPTDKYGRPVDSKGRSIY